MDLKKNAVRAESWNLSLTVKNILEYFVHVKRSCLQKQLCANNSQIAENSVSRFSTLLQNLYRVTNTFELSQKTF